MHKSDVILHAGSLSNGQGLDLSTTSQSLLHSLEDYLEQGFLPKYSNQHTRRSYRLRVTAFLIWLSEQGQFQGAADLMGRYQSALEEKKLKPVTVRGHLVVVRRFLMEALLMLQKDIGDYLRFREQMRLYRLPQVRGISQGRRLDLKCASRLLEAPGIDSHLGRRDTAILGLMVMCGLRRSEVSHLTWGQIERLDGHPVIRNLFSKHEHQRTVKIPVALWRILVAWGELTELPHEKDNPVFMRVRRGDHVKLDQALSDEAITYIVSKYGKSLGYDGLNPHTLRRTAARLARYGGASLEQVQLLLGHASPVTTSHYIGETLDLDDNAVDYIKVSVPHVTLLSSLDDHSH